MRWILVVIFSLLSSPCLAQSHTRLPVTVSVTIPEASPYRFIPPPPKTIDPRGMSPEQIVMARIEQVHSDPKPTSLWFDVAMADVERIDANRLRVTLPDSIHLPLQDGQSGQEINVEKRFKTFTIVYDLPEKLDLVMGLSRGDFVAFGSIDREAMQKFMQRMEQGETMQLLEEYNRLKLNLPTFIKFDSFQLDLSWDKIGTVEGNEILHPKIVGRAIRIKSSKPSNATPQTALTITNMSGSMGRQDPLILDYIRAMQSLEQALHQMEARGWDNGLRAQDRNMELSADELSGLLKGENIIQLPPRCRQIFVGP